MNNEKKFIKLTPFKMQVLQNFPFIDEDFDAITNYELLCKVVDYLNKTIDNVDVLNDEVEEYVNKFNELKAYVDNYFDNLDVQEEINNKLDEMAESGELTDIIAQYLRLAGVLAFNTVADMKQATNLVNGSICKTLGFHEVNDGGNATYKIRNIINTDVIDEATLIALSDENLVAELIINKNSVIVEQFGAYGDGTHDDTLAIQKAINYDRYATVILSKTYLITNTLTVLRNTTITGTGEIHYTGNSIAINCYIEDNLTLYPKIKNIHLIGNNDGIGINMNYTEMGTLIEDCIIENFNVGIEHGTRAWLSHFNKVRISNCNIAMNLKENSNGVTISQCLINNNVSGILCYRSNKISIINSEFENNTYDENGYAIKIERCTNVNVSENYFENNGDSTKDTYIIKISGNQSGLSIINNYFHEKINKSAIILDDNITCIGLNISQNTFFAGASDYATEYDINLGNNGLPQLFITNNVLQLNIYCNYLALHETALITNANEVLRSNLSIKNNLIFDDKQYNKKIKMINVNNKLRFYGNNDSLVWVMNFDSKKLEGFSIMTGTSANRPDPTTVRGQLYYDITINKLIISYDNSWKDANGNTV